MTGEQGARNQTAVMPLEMPSPLPKWLPDETFYSLASRYHRLTGHRLASATSAALFGHPRRGSEHDFPSRLSEFCERTGGALGDARTIALSKTILPFYLPFRTPAQSAEAVDAMTTRNVGMLKFRLGILTSRFRANHPLKACMQCMAEDIRKHGTTYWRLLHQYPGVWVCLQHCTMLRHSLIKATGVARFGWSLPDAGYLASPTWQLGYSRLESLMRLAELSHGLARLATGSKFSALELVGTYGRAASQSLHACSLSGREIRALAAQFFESVASLRTVPELAGLPANVEEAARALDRWMRRPRGGTHPLRHLAIIFWLFPSWQAFLEAHAAALRRWIAKNADQLRRLKHRAELPHQIVVQGAGQGIGEKLGLVVLQVGPRHVQSL